MLKNNSYSTGRQNFHKSQQNSDVKDKLTIQESNADDFLLYLKEIKKVIKDLEIKKG